MGKPSSGQREVALYLKRSYNFKRIRFDDSVRKICLLLYRYRKYERITWDKRKAIYDALYQVDPNIWLTHVLKRIELSGDRIIVEDPKYINEVQALQKTGFIVIRMSARSVERAESIGRFLGKKKKHIPGTIILAEYFNKDFAEQLKVDYSIYYENRPSLYKTLDELLTKLDK